MPSSGEDIELSRQPAPLVAAAKLLAGRGVYGLVWLGTDLVVEARYGPIVDFVEVGDHVTDHVPPLIGLEPDILALRDAPGTVINLPTVSIVTSPGGAPRLNFLVLWSPDDAAFLLVVSRAVPKGDLEVELSSHIRARLMAEAEVRQKSLELARANRDLEEYAAIISHDLKAPLRALRYIADDLGTALDMKDEAAARVILARMKEQSSRMSGMLTALLDYSSIGRKDEAIDTVDTLALVTSIVRSIPSPPGIRVELHGEWPAMKTLAAPLDLVLRNLVGNAITHHDRDVGVVRVVAIDLPHALEITITDDGPGIAPEHHEAIFLPFRTLGDTARTGGHGMGLSFVKRTVEAVEGQIELVSDGTRRRGTSFRLTWPKLSR
jgi:signal transduction histidine kinase